MRQFDAVARSLEPCSVDQLRQIYEQLHGEPTNARHRQWLVKRILWRRQALAEGGLSERARRRAAELARDSDLRTTAPADRAARPVEDNTVRPRRDRRLPIPGTVLTRAYKGRQVRVTVGEFDFTYEGQTYGSLSAVARAVTGSHCNGYQFFQLGGRR